MKTSFGAGLTALAVVGLGLSGSAWGAGLNEYDQAQLVPYARYTAAGATTAVGLMSRAAAPDRTVHWAFFDVDGVRRTSGSFTMSSGQLRPFIWSTEAAGAGASLAGVKGYLLFGIDSNGDGSVNASDGDYLAANAFFVDTANMDVAYIPTADVEGSSLNPAVVANWTNNPITGLDGSGQKDIDDGDVPDIQYLIDGAAGGDDTEIVIWSTAQVSSSQSMVLHDGDGASKTVTVSVPDTVLNIIDPESIPGITAVFFGDGFLRWTVPGSPTLDAFMFSVVSSTTFGAAQTLLPNYLE